MISTPILETLAYDFGTSVEHVRNALEMIDAGLSAPFIGRFRRGQVDLMSESGLRRLRRRRTELEDLDRRRGTILRMLEKEPSVTPAQIQEIQRCMDRFELEDLFIPHRRPEPEVQLALDRGLGALADALVAPIPKAERVALLGTDAEEKDEDNDGDGDAPNARGSQSEDAPAGGGDGRAGEAHAAEAHVGEAHAGEAHVAEAHVAEAHAEAEPYSPVEAHAETPVAAEGDTASEDSDEEKDSGAATATLDAPQESTPQVELKAALNAHLARVCSEYVRPDKGIHTELEALSGALRILSDRLGRNARVRSQVRNMLRRQGILTVRATADEGRLGRHRSLLKLKTPLRQLQGHRLIALRQGQKERAIQTIISVDPARVVQKVRAALGRYTHPAFDDVLLNVAAQALQYRLLPMVEQDVRLELKERADQEALRFLSQHLRQVLLAPPLWNHAVAGLDVNAKGDWTIVTLDHDGNVGTEAKIETKVDAVEKTPEVLGAELAAILTPAHAHHVAVGHGKGPRTAAIKIRAAMKAANLDAGVMLVNEAGLSSYANSELARTELPDKAVPARMAISLGRRLQDPLSELLKVDPRHLGLGHEQSLVSKANAKRVFSETIESCVAHVGCDPNHASELMLAHLPGLDRDTAKRLVARRAEKKFESREELRGEGLLSEAQWVGAIAFLRIYGSPEPLDASNLHPEQYELARKMLTASGSTFEQSYGRPGATKGLRRVDFQLDEYTWRDMMRELGFPGRDPRPRLYGPALLEADTDPILLVKDRVVEGLVSNVTSFGAFVDIGLPADAMVHISEVSDRYVRDARELLSIGQVVRARIVEPAGARLGLSLKNVPAPVREPRPERGPRRGPREGGEGSGAEGGERGGRGGGGRRGGRGDRDSRQPANVRAATSRRDGIGSRSSGGGGFGGGGRGGGGGGGQRGGPPGKGGTGRGGKREGDFGDRDEYVRLAETALNKKPKFNPFASFFKEKKDE